MLVSYFQLFEDMSNIYKLDTLSQLFNSNKCINKEKINK